MLLSWFQRTQKTVKQRCRSITQSIFKYTPFLKPNNNIFTSKQSRFRKLIFGQVLWQVGLLSFCSSIKLSLQSDSFIHFQRKPVFHANGRQNGKLVNYLRSFHIRVGSCSNMITGNWPQRCTENCSDRESTCSEQISEGAPHRAGGQDRGASTDHCRQKGECFGPE